MKEGDTLQWELLDKGGDKAADLEGSKLRIRFVSPQGPALLDKGSSLETSGTLISGKVTSDSRDGRYRYAVELVNPAGSSEPVDRARLPLGNGRSDIGHGRRRAERRIATPA